MAKLTTDLPYIAWRAGRPRFSPGPQQRKLGFKGQDLRHPDGAWFSQAEAQAFAQTRLGEIAAARAAHKAGQARKARALAAGAQKLGFALPAPASGHAPRVLSVSDLFDAWFAAPRMQGRTVTDGRRVQKAAAPATIDSYRKARNVLEQFDGEIATAPAEALSKPILYDLYERLWSARGLPMACACLRTLSAALSWGMKRGLVRLAVNPCFNLGMETPDGRLRCLTPPEVRHFVAVADQVGRPEIGDAIIMGVWTGQRQSERLQLIDAGLLDGRRIFRQQKTGAIVALRPTPELETRLAALRARRAGWKVEALNVILDEHTRQPFNANHYRHVFAQVRAEAAKTLPSLADARDQDLRDTSVTWLARAQCTHMEIAAITGHEVASVQAILKHYLAQHPELADNALAKMMHWYEGQGEG